MPIQYGVVLIITINACKINKELFIIYVCAIENRAEAHTFTPILTDGIKILYY